MTRVVAPSAWTSHSDLDKKESDGRDPPQWTIGDNDMYVFRETMSKNIQSYIRSLNFGHRVQLNDK